MASIVNLKAKGLNLSPNPLSVQEGSLIEAKNIVIRRDDVIESRRGFKLYGDAFGSSNDRLSQVMSYKNRILRHYNTTLQYDNGSGTFTSFAGNYSEAETGLRIKSIDSNGNFYFTTSDGIKKLSAATPSEFSSASGYIYNAGGVKALDVTGRLNIQLGNETGFLPGDSAVAYRVVWAYKDANENLVRGTPSQRIQIYNPLLTLVLEDYMVILEALDNLNQAGSMINDGNYVQTLRLNLTASVDDLRTNLLSLSSKLDNELYFANTTGVGTPFQITGATISGGIATVQFAASANDLNNYFVSGKKMGLTGFSPATGTIAESEVVVTVDNTAKTVTFLTSATGAVTITGTQIHSYEFRGLNVIPVPSTPATHGDTENCQTYLMAILSRLRSESSSIIPTILVTTYLDPIDFTTTATVILNVTIPQDVILGKHFLQIYRSSIAQASTQAVLSTDVFPDDELQQVYEAFPTAAEISQGYMIVEDITPDAFRGTNLYTNAVTGDGIAQSNDIPPFAKDINFFKNVIFYANTRTRYRLSMALLGVADVIASYNDANPPKLIVNTGSTSNVYTFRTGIQEVTTIKTLVKASIPTSGYFTLNSANDTFQYYVWFDKTGTNPDPAVAGKTGIKVDISSASIVTASDVANRLNNVLALYIQDFICTVLTDTVTVTNIDQGSSTNAADVTSGSTIAVTTQGRGEDVATNTVLLSTVVSPSIAVEQTTQSFIRILNKNTSETVYGFYLSGAQDVPGKFLLETRQLTTDAFYIETNNSDFGFVFNPDISPVVEVAAGVSITVANPTNITTSTNHGFVTGDSVIIVGSQTTPSIDGRFVVTKISNTVFSIPVNVIVSPVVLVNQIGISKVTSVQSATNETKPNRVYYSKIQQPEAVPQLNYFDVGASEKKILRIFPLRDSLFVFKEDGLWRISGESAPFTVSLFDSSCNLIVPDSIGIGDNQIYAWTTQGIQTVTESGPSIISRVIDIEILKLGTTQFTNFKTATWGVGYDSDNSYTVFTVKDINDSVATMAYTYNTLTSSWVTIEKSNTCGIVNPGDDKLYIGAGDVNYIEQERKDFSRYDYSDRELSFLLTEANYFGTRMQITSITGIVKGDVVVQTQTLSVYTINDLLRTLDQDPGLADKNYYSLLKASGGNNLSSVLESIINKLAVDTGRLGHVGSTPSVTYTNLIPIPTDFAGLKVSYNLFIDLINGDVGITFSSYKHITTNTTFESVINSVTTSTKQIAINTALDFVAGPIVIFKSIPMSFIYAPITMGDPLGWKHLREATVMFQNKAFTSGRLSVASDLLPQFVLAGDFNAQGNGAFGVTDSFGGGFFGGGSHSVPFRTFIPRECQRCRYILMKFEHNTAREKIAIYGITVTGEISQSSRAYRE